MTQVEIDNAVAEVTGETLCDVRRIGFSIADPLEVCFDPEPDDLPPNIIDWDELELERNYAMYPMRRDRRRWAA
ncbi:hypothetical protein [Thalassoglobus polymorphus]|uniref:Uncharacterized protein n=1 Tax=Thalassoglobus polymorphus TaxID=2527994 RepID=A0A517QQQ5_9PLAN|nr:hypothetical protein [Thalassoglobus polymorphus]QDT33966.1 hypothetical protein Mal48_32230 [Thalassoglobus polymorphus]